MHFDQLLALVEDQTLQLLLGSPALRLLKALDPGILRPSLLRAVVKDLHAPEDLMRDPRKRKLLLDLLPSSDASTLAAELGGDTHDTYQYLDDVKIARNSPREAALFAFFGVVPIEVAEEFVPDLGTVGPESQLFAHQRKASRKVSTVLGLEPHRVLLHMPTGSGKTRTAMNVIADHLRRTEPTVVVWLVHNEELCEQAAIEFEAVWKQIGDRDISLLRFWGSHELNLNDAHDAVLIAGFAKTFSRAKKSLNFIATLADRTSLVIVDEAHKAVAETYQLVLEVLAEKWPDTALLGLTATPGRTLAEIDVDEKLADFFNRRKVGLEIEGYDNPVDFLIDEGYLARPKFVSLLNSGSMELTPKDLEELSTSFEIPQRILQALAEDEQRNLMIVRQLESLITTNSRILVFAATVGHARLLATVLQARGLEAYAVEAATDSLERSRIIARFKSDTDTPIVLTNFGVLTSGFDAPRTSAALIARPTNSLVLYMQMVGRATRGPKAGGNKDATIVTVIDSALPVFTDIGEAFLNWEDVWQ